jgi:hypothetical protein
MGYPSRRVGNVYNRLPGYNIGARLHSLICTCREEDAIFGMEAMSLNQLLVKVARGGDGIIVAVAPVIKVKSVAIRGVEVFAPFGASVAL